MAYDCGTNVRVTHCTITQYIKYRSSHRIWPIPERLDIFLDHQKVDTDFLASKPIKQLVKWVKMTDFNGKFNLNGHFLRVFQVVLAMRDLFQVVFELKKKEIELARQHIQSKVIHHDQPITLNIKSTLEPSHFHYKEHNRSEPNIPNKYVAKEVIPITIQFNGVNSSKYSI